ncbi:hypothetical protein CDD83_1812 [Cordyceps sp. RAO-2017]|nr:hypothetical protein CDD83_1812 [Cordyceps sp. RAO-2017]
MDENKAKLQNLKKAADKLWKNHKYLPKDIPKADIDKLDQCQILDPIGAAQYYKIDRLEQYGPCKPDDSGEAGGNCKALTDLSKYIKKLYTVLDKKRRH